MQNNGRITKADLFVTQTHLCLDDPRGPWTAGRPSDVIGWAVDHVRAVTERPGQGELPSHFLVELDDDSGVVVTEPTIEGHVGIATLHSLGPPVDWTEESGAFLMIGGQPDARRYLSCLTELIRSAPRPSEVIGHARRHSFDYWAETLTDSLGGERGPAAQETAQDAWAKMSERRQQAGKPDEEEEDDRAEAETP